MLRPNACLLNAAAGRVCSSTGRSEFCVAHSAAAEASDCFLLFTRSRRQDHGHLPPFHLRFRLDRCHVIEIVAHSMHEIEP